MSIFARLRSMLRRYARRMLERHADVLYEGPEPPHRQLQTRARAFLLVGYERTDEQWVAFAQRLATNTYREGFQRGYEWRAKRWPENTVGGPPEQRAEQLANDRLLVAQADPQLSFAFTSGGDPRDPLAEMTAEQRRAIMRLPVGTEVEFHIDPEQRPLGYGNPGFHRDEQDGTYGSDL